MLHSSIYYLQGLNRIARMQLSEQEPGLMRLVPSCLSVVIQIASTAHCHWSTSCSGLTHAQYAMDTLRAKVRNFSLQIFSRWLIYLIDLVDDNLFQCFTFLPTQHTAFFF